MNKTYTEGPVRTDDLQVGDLILVEWAQYWGPIKAIKPYVSTVDPHPDWRVAVFAKPGIEVTMTPGGTWFPA